MDAGSFRNKVEGTHVLHEGTIMPGILYFAVPGGSGFPWWLRMMAGPECSIKY